MMSVLAELYEYWPLVWAVNHDAHGKSHLRLIAGMLEDGSRCRRVPCGLQKTDVVQDLASAFRSHRGFLCHDMFLRYVTWTLLVFTH